MKIKEVSFQIVKIFLIRFKRKGLQKLSPVGQIYRFYRWVRRLYFWTLFQGGHKMYVNGRDKVITPWLLLKRVWEEYESQLFKKVIDKGMVVVDLGANIGWYTLIAARLVGREGKVYAFEPDPKNCSLLEKNVQMNGCNNVIIEKKAILNQCGPIKLFLCSDNLGDHRIYDSHDGRKWTTVEGTTLDEYFRNKHDKVDIIKMDIQGAEMAAILGMEEVIKANQNLKIFTEFWPRGIRMAGFSPREFMNTLLEYGFKLYLIDEQKEVIKEIYVDEVMKLCEGEKSVDLFLEK